MSVVRIKRFVWQSLWGSWHPSPPPYPQKRGKNLSVLWFLSLNQDFPKRTQTCFEYCRLWVWVIMQLSSIFVCFCVFVLFFKKTIHNRCRGMKWQEKQNTSSTNWTKQSLNAGGPQLARICNSCERPSTSHYLGMFHSISFHLTPTINELPGCLNCILNLNC